MRKVRVQIPSSPPKFESARRKLRQAEPPVPINSVVVVRLCRNRILPSRVLSKVWAMFMEDSGRADGFNSLIVHQLLHPWRNGNAAVCKTVTSRLDTDRVLQDLTNELVSRFFENLSLCQCRTVASWRKPIRGKSGHHRTAYQRETGHGVVIPQNGWRLL
jgi:hypothetical protein